MKKRTDLGLRQRLFPALGVICGAILFPYQAAALNIHALTTDITDSRFEEFVEFANFVNDNPDDMSYRKSWINPLKSGLSLSHDDKMCLAEAVYYEARGERETGQIAVAEVIVNRQKKGFAKSICGVVNQKFRGVCQFSFACVPEDRRSPVNRRQWSKAEEIAEDVLEGQAEEVTKDALYFHPVSTGRPYWTSRLERVASIGGHVFYK